MENGKPSCPMGLQLAISKNPNGEPSSTGGQAFKLIYRVGVPFAMDYGGDGSSGTMMKQQLKPSQG